MPRKEIEGDWVMGWPDRKRAALMHSTDEQGRTIYGRTPILDLEGLITPTDSFYIVAQLQMPEPVHPDDYVFSIGGLVDRPVEYTLDDLRRLPGKTVRAVTECAGNDAEFFDFLNDRSNNRKPSLRMKHEEYGTWRSQPDSAEIDIDAIIQSMPSTCLVSGGEWIGVPLGGLIGGAFSETASAWRPDVVAPIPLARTRQLERGYNQSAALAEGAAEVLAAPVADLLVRTRPTLAQARLSAAERIRNVAGAFALAPGADVAGRRVLLVDDVLTTGATLAAAALPLLDAGARVDVAALALAGA